MCHRARSPLRGQDFADLAEAVERGAVDGDNALDEPRLRSRYVVELSCWRDMRNDLLGQVVADAGSIRRAAKALRVPRSTLGAWVQAMKRGGSCGR